MQAVSEDGRAVVYRNEQTFFVYYFNGESVITGKFSLSFDAGPVKKEYHEENTSHSPIKVTIVDKTIVIYVISYDRLKIAQVRL